MTKEHGLYKLIYMKGKEYTPPQKRVNKLVTYVSVAGDWSQDKGEVRKKNEYWVSLCDEENLLKLNV